MYQTSAVIFTLYLVTLAIDSKLCPFFKINSVLQKLWHLSLGATVYKWVKVFKNGPSKIGGSQPLRHFTWSILEYLYPNVLNKTFRFSDVFRGYTSGTLVENGLKRYCSEYFRKLPEKRL